MCYDVEGRAIRPTPKAVISRQRVRYTGSPWDTTPSEAGSEDDGTKSSSDAAGPSVRQMTPSPSLAKRRICLSGGGETSTLEKMSIAHRSWLQSQRPPQRGTRHVSTRYVRFIGSAPTQCRFKHESRSDSTNRRVKTPLETEAMAQRRWCAGFPNMRWLFLSGCILGSSLRRPWLHRGQRLKVMPASQVQSGSRREA